MTTRIATGAIEPSADSADRVRIEDRVETVDAAVRGACSSGCPRVSSSTMLNSSGGKRS
jgi:hypothetical protein